MTVFNSRISTVILGCIVSVALHGFVGMGTASAQSSRRTPTGGADNGLAVVAAIEKTVTSAIEKAERSVVSIACGPKGDAAELLKPDHIPHRFGSGVVLSADGLILTNYHLLGKVKKSDYVVWINRHGYKATVHAADPWSDLAVLKIEAKNLVPMEMGDVTRARKGQFVISLGNPYATARDGSPSASWGIISNFARTSGPARTEDGILRQGDTLHYFGTLIQTDTRLNLGTSGGALVDLRGRMIGLTTAEAALLGFEKSAGYAIPVNDTFQRTINKLKSGQEIAYGFLGVGASPAGDAKTGETHRRGVQLDRVVLGAPGAAAGLHVGDRVTHIGDDPIILPNDLLLHVGRRETGSTVVIRFERDGQQKMCMATLSKRYVAATRPVITAVVPRTWRGARFDYATAIPRFSMKSHDADPKGCIAVVDVQRDSPAWKADLRPGTFVSHVGESRVSTPDEFYAIIRKTSPDAEVTLQLSSYDKKDHKRIVQGSY